MTNRNEVIELTAQSDIGQPQSLLTIVGGKVQQTNFHSYRLLRNNELPELDVHLVDSDEAPGGIGEAAVPLVAPAICNAIFAATGKRLRELPIGRQKLATT